MDIKIEFAESKKDFSCIKLLFLEYAESLDFSLSFQDFEKEIENIPGNYAMPNGCIFLARDGINFIGCVGMRPLKKNSCEIKRLYLKPSYRGFGIGKLLTEKVVDYCRKRKYSKIFLDTTSKMEAAIRIYKSLGFVETYPYYINPLQGVKFFELNLVSNI